MSSKEKDELDVLNNSDEDIGAEEILKAKKATRAQSQENRTTIRTNTRRRNQDRKQ